MQFAAGGFGQRAGVEQHDHAGCLLAGVGYRLANGIDQRVGGENFLHAAADFCRNANPLLAFDIHRKRRHPTFAHHFDFALDGFFDVLRVQILPAHDQQVFQATGDKQLAVVHKPQIAGAQPGRPLKLDKGVGTGLGVAPVTVGNTRAAGPHFTDAILSQHVELTRFDDQYRVFRLAGATAHHRATVARHNAVIGQRQFVQAQGRDTLTALTTGHKQRGLSQTIGGEITGGGKTAGGELLGEALKAVLADRFRTRVRHAPAAQVQACQRRVTDSLAAQSIRKVRAAADSAAVLADRFKPAQRAGQKVRRGHQYARHTAENRLQQTANQAHVVVQRQPADNDVVRVQVDAKTTANQYFIGHQIAVGDLHPFGQGGGTRGVLQERNVVSLQDDRLPALSNARFKLIDTQQLWRAFA